MTELQLRFDSSLTLAETQSADARNSQIPNHGLLATKRSHCPGTETLQRCTEMNKFSMIDYSKRLNTMLISKILHHAMQQKQCAEMSSDLFSFKFWSSS